MVSISYCDTGSRTWLVFLTVTESDIRQEDFSVSYCDTVRRQTRSKEIVSISYCDTGSRTWLVFLTVTESDIRQGDA